MIRLYSVLMDQIGELNDAMHREWQADYAQVEELKEEMSQEWLFGINQVPVQSSAETSPL